MAKTLINNLLANIKMHQNHKTLCFVPDLSTIKTAAAVAPGNGGVKAAGCLHATTTAFSSVMSIMMIVTLHFVQQPVLVHIGD